MGDDDLSPGVRSLAIVVTVAGFLLGCYLAYDSARETRELRKSVNAIGVEAAAELEKCAKERLHTCWWEPPRRPFASVTFLPGHPPVVCETTEKWGHECWTMRPIQCPGGR